MLLQKVSSKTIIINTTGNQFLYAVSNIHQLSFVIIIRDFAMNACKMYVKPTRNRFSLAHLTLWSLSPNAEISVANGRIPRISKFWRYFVCVDLLQRENRYRKGFRCTDDAAFQWRWEEWLKKLLSYKTQKRSCLSVLPSDGSCIQAVGMRNAIMHVYNYLLLAIFYYYYYYEN